MTLSLTDLPYSSGGAVEGLWHFQLRDSLNTQMATAVIENGRTVIPVSGAILKRFVVLMGSVVGAVRVEGEPCRIGDVAGLVPAAEPAVRVEQTAPTPDVAPQVKPAAQPQHQQGKRK